jgi:outer membrane protein TolC
MQAKIVLEQQERRYLELVYLAFSEVEVELNRKQALSDRYDAFVRAEQNATAALELGLDQYQRGLVDYTTVLEAQRRAFDAQTTLIELRNQQLKNRVNLLLALGGDY